MERAVEIILREFEKRAAREWEQFAADGERGNGGSPNRLQSTYRFKLLGLPLFFPFPYRPGIFLTSAG